MSILDWYHRREYGVLDMHPDGFDFRDRNETRDIAWSEVTQIDAWRWNVGGESTFHVSLFVRDQDVFEIDNKTAGFDALERAMLERWPSIRPEWARITAAADPMQQATLWRRDR